MIVTDSSVVCAALADNGSLGSWARALMGEGQVVAPHLMPVEVTSALRRMSGQGALSSDAAALALADLPDLRVDLWEFAPFARRVWQLRGSVSSYDAWYVAMAEGLDAPLATLDLRLAKAAGPRCGFVTPPL